MLRCRAWNGVKVQPSIKADKTALVAYGQAQQVAVCNLPVAQQVVPVQLIGVEQAVVVGKKGVRRVCSSLCQAADDCRQRQGLGVGGLGHDAQAAVLREWAGGPAVSNLLLQPLRGAGVVHVRRIQQGDQDIDVEQGTHGLNAVGIAQAIDQFVADNDPARPEGHEPCGRGGQVVDGLGCCTSGQRLAQQARDYFAQTRVFGAGDFFGGNQGIVFKINGGAQDMPPAFSWE